MYNQQAISAARSAARSAQAHLTLGNPRSAMFEIRCAKSGAAKTGHNLTSLVVPRNITAITMMAARQGEGSSVRQMLNLMS